MYDISEKNTTNLGRADTLTNFYSGGSRDEPLEHRLPSPLIKNATEKNRKAP